MDEEAVKWLREQVTARLETAQAAAAAEGGSHAVWLPAYGTVVDAADEDWAVITDTVDEIAVHMALNDPQDVIARCEAELAILDEYTSRDRDVDLMLGPSVARQREWQGLRLAVRLLASGYRHREGYAEHWGDVNQPAEPGVSTA